MLLATFVWLGAVQAPGADFRAEVEKDWARQEQRFGRTADSAQALREALRRADTLCADPAAMGEAARLESFRRTLEGLRGALANPDSLPAAARLESYHAVRWLTRDWLLSDPQVAGRPIVFMKRNRFICQMLHEYMGYFYDYGNIPAGGGLFVLEEPGRSMNIRDLTPASLPPGNYTTLALSYDARTLFFAFAERSATKPDFRSPSRRSFHLFSLEIEGGRLRQITDGVEDDFDPHPLPDGGLAFMSSRRGGFARCNNAWEPIASYTLHRVQPDGSGLRVLSVHETSEWHPFVLNDGRLVYIRWDYVDRSAANFHGLWTCRPDGSAVAGLFGNYTMRINACYQPRPIPGSDRLLFVAGAHHADVGGSLVLLDPNRTGYDPKDGQDLFDGVEVLTPEVCFPESDGWPKSYFHGPWPLSEHCSLVAFSLDPLPGMSSGHSKDTRTGLYYFDRGGNLELLYQDSTISSMYPIPLAARRPPPTIASVLDETLGQEGEFLLQDVRRSHFSLPPNRPIRELRVFQVLPKGGSHTANDPRLGHANAESARLLLGTVPVEPDGSAYFRAPAGKPLYFQAVDEHGRAVQSMRSVTYLQPGERRSCVGCHEPVGAAAANLPVLAARRAPSILAPGPAGSQPFSFPLLVQPVLERHCVRCHDGTPGPGKSKPALTAGPAGAFSRGYAELKPYLRWYEWGGASISQIATHPGRIGADASPLSRIIDDATHRAEVRMTDGERRQLYLWMDANAPFYGSYDPEEQLAQRSGRPTPVPRVQ